MLSLSREAIPWHQFINEKNLKYCTDDAIDLISKILIYDHKERYSAREAMDHPYFKEARIKYHELFDNSG